MEKVKDPRKYDRGRGIIGFEGFGKSGGITHDPTVVSSEQFPFHGVVEHAKRGGSGVVVIDRIGVGANPTSEYGVFNSRTRRWGHIRLGTEIVGFARRRGDEYSITSMEVASSKSKKH